MTLTRQAVSLRETAPARINGRALLGILGYTKVLGGEVASGVLVEGLPKPARRIFASPIRGSSWYPYSSYVSLLKAFGRWAEVSPKDHLHELGRRALSRDASNLLRILSIFSSVEALVHRGFGSWGAFLWSRHCDTGEVFLADAGHRTATMGLRAFPEVSALHCRVSCGYLEAMGKAVGAKDIQMTHSACVHRGDPHCEFRGEW